MNKSDIAIVALLFILLLGWGYFVRTHPPPAPPAAPAAAQALASKPAALEAATETGTVGAVSQPAATVTNAAAPAAAVPEVPAEPEAPEQKVVISNAQAVVTVSSRGGGITSMELLDYPATVEPHSPPLVLDFDARPALSFVDDAQLGASRDFTLSASSNTVTVTKTLAGGLRLDRRIVLNRDYSLQVTDTFTNTGAAAVSMPVYGVRVGPMSLTGESQTSKGALAYLGLDSLADVGGERVRYWMSGGFMKKSPLLALLGAKPSGNEAPPTSVAYRTRTPTVWVAAKNKFFVQILHSEKGSQDCELYASRDPNDPRAGVQTVSGALLFREQVIAPGQSVSSTLDYYAGPKKYTMLKRLPDRQSDVMEFGRWFGWICQLLLPTLTGMYAVTRNYGIAVILLTALVRIIFWPVTHLSTESMKKMQKIQPLVLQLKEKYKDNPQKLNQETMALYRQHKVNPMSGCLPVVVQIPVFIALFTVLRSAVELRFAGFLWIHDLSEPEGLFASIIPFGGLNILPILMTGATLWQQKLTPQAGDPAQQKMMMLMPVVMLFIFYNMASALVLYWTTSTLFSIAQLIRQKRTGGQEAQPTAAPVAGVAGKRGRRHRK